MHHFEAARKTQIFPVAEMLFKNKFVGEKIVLSQLESNEVPSLQLSGQDRSLDAIQVPRETM